MKYRLSKIGFIISTILLITCNDNLYEIISLPDGNSYRINTQSGELMLIDGEKLTKVESAIEFKGTSTLDLEPKLWPRDTSYYFYFKWPEDYKSYYMVHLDSLKVNMVTTWREDMMFYKMKISLDDSTKSMDEVKATKLNTSFTDLWGFERLEMEVPLDNMTRLINSEGVPRGLSLNSDLECTLEDYISLLDWSIGWTPK